MPLNALERLFKRHLVWGRKESAVSRPRLMIEFGGSCKRYVNSVVSALARMTETNAWKCTLGPIDIA